MVPLTGPFPDIGEEARQTAELWLQSKDGHVMLDGAAYTLMIRWADTGLDAALTRRVARELAREDLLAVIGPYGSVPALEAVRVFDPLGIPTLITWATYPYITPGHPFTFRINYNEKLLGQALLELASSFGAQSLGIVIAEQETFSEEFGSQLAQQARAQGFQVQVSYFRENDLASQRQALQQVAQTDVLIWPLYGDQTRSLLAIAKELGLTQPVLGTDTWESFELLHCEECSNLFFITPWVANKRVLTAIPEPAAWEFAELYQANYAQLPNQISALTWDAFELWAQALEQCASLTGDLTRDRACVQETLAQGTWRGLTGPIRFNEDGDALRCLLVVTWAEDGLWALHDRICLSELE